MAAPPTAAMAAAPSCPACYEPLKKDDVTWRWECGHEIHLVCMQRMLKGTPDPNCPLCRVAWRGAEDDVMVMQLLSLYGLDAIEADPEDDVAVVAATPESKRQKTEAGGSDVPNMLKPPPDEAPLWAVPLCHGHESDRRMHWTCSVGGDGVKKMGWHCYECNSYLSYGQALQIMYEEQPTFSKCKHHKKFRSLMLDYMTGTVKLICTFDPSVNAESPKLRALHPEHR